MLWTLTATCLRTNQISWRCKARSAKSRDKTWNTIEISATLTNRLFNCIVCQFVRDFDGWRHYWLIFFYFIHFLIVAHNWNGKLMKPSFKMDQMSACRLQICVFLLLFNCDPKISFVNFAMKTLKRLSRINIITL